MMMKTFLRRCVAATVAAVLLLPSSSLAQTQGPTFRSPTDQELTQTKNGGVNWITYGGALNNQRYSTLDQLNPGNVGQLRGAWLSRLGSARGTKYIFEADPLVIDGVMYIPTGNDDIFALDSKTGKKLWEYNSDIPQVNDLICCGWDNRGIGSGQGMIFSGQLDGSFVALDQTTGKIAWRTQLEDYHDGFSITGATRYYDGMVFTGMSGSENGVRGRMYGLDAKTGREIWRFYTIPAPGDIGGDTWPSPSDPDPVKRDAYLHGGATVWQAPAVDPELGMMYFSTGNAGPDYDGSVRPGNNLFTASILALDYKTGQYKWHFQEAHHEIWDYDAPSPVVLFDQMYNGVMRKGLSQAGKTGWTYYLDRTNGQALIGIDEKPVNQEPRQATSATQPIPVGDKFVRDCITTPIQDFPIIGCMFDPFFDLPVVQPGQSHNFSPTSWDPQTGYTYTMASQSVTARAMRPEGYQLGKRYTAGANVTPLDQPVESTLTAMDSRTNTIAWQKTFPGAQSYGAVTTAGGLLFVGQVDGNLVAYNAKTGDQLWKFQTGWGISAPPMTYSVDGVQYVAVASGGNRGGVSTTDGDAVWAFSLNGTIDELAAPPPIQTKTALGGPFVKIGDTVGTGRDAVATIGGDRIFDGTISTLDYAFVPLKVLVPVGTTLNWQNNGAVIHTASATNGAWNTGDIPSGGAASVTFNTSGIFTYNCSPHPWMIGQISVT
jgi:quinohemoprotein ethanol dehydrogenase